MSKYFYYLNKFFQSIIIMSIFSVMEYQFISLFVNIPVRHVMQEISTDIPAQVCDYYIQWMF